MKKILMALFFLLSSYVFSQEKISSELDEIISKINDPDLNVINAYRENITILNSINLLLERDIKSELILNYIHSKICLNTFLNKQVTNDFKYGALKNYYLIKLKIVDRKIEFIESSNEYLDNFNDFVKAKEKNCQFKVIETEEMLKVKIEKSDLKGLYYEILTLKEKTHPFFVQFINSLFEMRSKITSFSRIDGESFEKGDFENNFIKYYYLESEKNNSKAKIINSEYEEMLKIKVEDSYDKYCKGVSRYENIPFKSIREMLCVDDNLSKMTKNCNQYFCFKVVDNLKDFIEITPKIPLLIVNESKEEKCVDDFLLSAKYKKTLIDQLTDLSSEKFHNEKKCPIDVSFISSQSTFKVFKKLVGLPRVKLMNSEIFKEQYIVKDQKGYFFEISGSTLEKIKTNQVTNYRKKLLEKIEKNGIWEKNLNEMYQICSNKVDLDYFKEKYDLQFNQMIKSRMKTDSKECFYYTFKDTDSLKKAIIFLDVRI